MITVIVGQKVPNSDQIVVDGGTYNEEDNVLVVNEVGIKSYVQAYFIEHGRVFANVNEPEVNGTD